MTYYEILQVSPNASQEVIEATWKVLMQKYHPDAQSGLSPEARHEKSVRLNEAHDVLSDPRKREAYDRELEQQEKLRKGPQKVDPRFGGINEGAYPDAYPNPYDLRGHPPRIRFDPVDLYEEFVTAADLPKAIEHALASAGQRVLEKVIRDNPIIGEILDHARGVPRTKKRSG